MQFQQFLQSLVTIIFLSPPFKILCMLYLFSSSNTIFFSSSECFQTWHCESKKIGFLYQHCEFQEEHATSHPYPMSLNMYCRNLILAATLLLMLSIIWQILSIYSYCDTSGTNKEIYIFSAPQHVGFSKY